MPELRKDPIIGRWVIISTARGKRPVDFTPDTKDERSLANCPFCYNREEMTPSEIFAIREPGTQPNTPGWKVRVVPNKFPALGLEDGYSKRGIGMYDQMTG